MTTSAALKHNLMPRTASAPGELLWGEAPRKQPIAPLVLMAAVLLIVAAPAAFASGGGSSNPITLMRQAAATTYDLTQLMEQSNKSLGNIDEHSKKMLIVQDNLDDIAKSSAGMADKTVKIDETLDVVGATAKGQRTQLGQVGAKLVATEETKQGLLKDINGSLGSTKAIVKSFGTIESSMGSMNKNLQQAIAAMAASGPLTKEFAENRTRVAIAGGDGTKYKVPNFAPNARVMSIVLPMINTMQNGGALPARKDKHEASNPIVGFALKNSVPDGTNVVANVVKYDGFYGLPGPQFFVENRIHGF